MLFASKKPSKIWHVNVDNIVISKLVKTKTNFNYLIGIKFDKAIRPLVLIMAKMSGYVKTFKGKEGNKEKRNELMPFRIGDYKLQEKHIAIWIKIEDLKNIELNVLPVYDDRYIKNKITTYGDKVYTNFCGLNVPEDDIECESFIVIFIDSLLVYENQYYLKVYLNNCAYKIVNKQMTDYLDENVFEDWILQMLYYDRIDAINLSKNSVLEDRGYI